MLELKIKKNHHDAVIPKYAYQGDVGMDVTAISKKTTQDYIEYKTGLNFEIPEDHFMLVFPRSSVTNKSLIMANCVGVIDSGYRGDLFIRFRKIGEKEYNIGDKVAQLVILPFPKINIQEVKELSQGVRGESGYGSSGE